MYWKLSNEIKILLFLALMFAAAGCYPMIQWALGKHKSYRKDFKDYPRGRKAIFPFAI